MENTVKIIKLLTLQVLFIIPQLLYSQYLEPKDIDIFINGYEQLENVITENLTDDTDDIVWIDYEHSVEEGVWFISVLYLLNDEEFNKYKQIFNDLFNAKVPGELEKVFKLIGWETNGHKKFWTILLGSVYVSAKKEMSGSFLEIINSREPELFNINDLEIINMRLDDINGL
jgi:hypothetical protein